jgi:LysM repeat protein
LNNSSKSSNKRHGSGYDETLTACGQTISPKFFGAAAGLSEAGTTNLLHKCIHLRIGKVAGNCPVFPRLGFLLSLFVIFVLSGCFQQASESLEPVNSTLEPLNIPGNVDNAEGQTEDQNDITSLPSTPTFPPITIISQPSGGLNNGQPTPEPDDKTEQAVDALDSAGASADSTTPMFITPGLPSGPVAFDTPIATLDGGALTATPSGLITPTGLFSGIDGACSYIVASGDNLYRIAVANNTTVEAMRQVNPDLVGEAPILQPGQVLQLPDCEAGASSAPSSSDAGSTDAGITSPATQPSAPAATGGQTYTVKAGDTLFSIATSFGITVQDIVNANNLANPDALQVGQQLIIPSS